MSGNNTFTFELSVYDNKNGIGNDTTTIQILKNGTSSSLRSSAVPPVATTGTQPIPGSTQQTPAMNNKPPNAEAIASPNSVDPGQQVALVGTGSDDEDGTISSVLWEQLDGSTVTLQNKDKSVASFTAPNEESTLEFKLTVTDNQGQTDSTTIKVEVKGPGVESSSDEATTGSANSNGDTDIEGD